MIARLSYYINSYIQTSTRYLAKVDYDDYHKLSKDIVDDSKAELLYQLLHTSTRYLTALERIMTENGSTGFFVGNKMTIADLAMWRMWGWIVSAATFYLSHTNFHTPAVPLIFLYLKCTGQPPLSLLPKMVIITTILKIWYIFCYVM